MLYNGFFLENMKFLLLEFMFNMDEKMVEMEVWFVFVVKFKIDFVFKVFVDKVYDEIR